MGDIDFNCHACAWNWRGTSWNCPKCGVHVIETRGPQTYTAMELRQLKGIEEPTQTKLLAN